MDTAPTSVVLAPLVKEIMRTNPEWSASKCHREARQRLKMRAQYEAERAAALSSPAVIASRAVDHEFGNPIDYADPTGDTATWRADKKRAA